MDHEQLLCFRKTYNEKRILLSFNGPFSQGLIEEIGSALRKYLQSGVMECASAMDVFAVYVELAQNVREYAALRGYDELESSATVIISRHDAGHYIIAAANVVKRSDGERLLSRLDELNALDKTQLKALYKERLREPRSEHHRAGLGLIDIARKATAPISGKLFSLDDDNCFFSLLVVI